MGAHRSPRRRPLDRSNPPDDLGAVSGASDRSGLVLRSVLPLLVLLAAAGTARAHLASDSYLRIEIQEARPFGGQWDIALRDLDAAIGLDLDQDGTITWGELRGRAKEIEAYAFERLTL